MNQSIQLKEGPCLPFEDIRSKSKILVVEDEEGVRNFIRRSMHKAGYTNVSFAENPVVALDKYKDNFDLYILDCNMPAMGGKEYWDRIKSIYPEARGIVATSHYTDWTLREMAEKGIRHLVAKPFSYHDLVSKIDDVILDY